MNNLYIPLASIAICFVIWWIAGYFVLDPDQFAYITRLGKFIKTKKSGLRHALWPIDKVTKLPVSGQQIPFTRIGIMAKEKEYLGKIRDEAIMGLDLVMNFQFHTDLNIEKTINYLGDPPDIDRLINLLEEPAQTSLRAEGKDLCWLQLMIERDEISQAVLKELLEDATGPLPLSSLKNVSFSIKHVDIPQKLLDSINEPAIQRILMEASKSEAERERILRAGKGKGDAEAREEIYKIASKYPDMERLLTMREMAQGPATTIFVPREILTALESYIGKPLGGQEEVVNLLKRILGKFPA